MKIGRRIGVGNGYDWEFTTPIGSAERSTDIEQMRDTFHTITNGEYSQLLYKLFSKERVEAELEKFLEFDFMPGVGGGIGMTRMISALDTQS